MTVQDTYTHLCRE